MGKWIKFASLGVQMGLAIWAMSALGGWLDAARPSWIPWKKSLTLFAVFGTTVSTLVQVIRMQEREERERKK